MKKLPYRLPAAFALLVSALLLCGCEKYAVSDDVKGVIRSNDLSMELKIRTDSGGYTIGRMDDDGAAGGYFLQIDVTDTFSMRGEAPVTPGKEYRLSFTMKNIDADPLIGYSFWKEPVTSLRHYTFRGENGNPPSSETQQIHEGWVTYEETFDTREGEDSMMITLLCGKGRFCIREINIEELP